jgi:hypothetical protein
MIPVEDTGIGNMYRPTCHICFTSSVRGVHLIFLDSFVVGGYRTMRCEILSCGLS